LGFFYDGLLIFGSFGPAPTPVFKIVHIGGFFVILANSVFAVVVGIVLGRILVMAVVGVVWIAVVLHLFLGPLELLDEVYNGPVLVMRYVYFIIILAAFDL
jgi:hypothetical protein